MKLIYHPNPILEQKLTDVNIETPAFDPKELKGQMAEIMLKNNGVGLAACQVDLDQSLFIMGNDPRNILLVMNPMILEHTSETVLEYEGCLSFPGIFVKVQRPKEILVQFRDENMEEQTVKISDYSARVFLHEYDHLQGITFKDRVSKLKWDRAFTKKEKIRKKIFRV